MSSSVDGGWPVPPDHPIAIAVAGALELACARLREVPELRDALGSRVLLTLEAELQDGTTVELAAVRPPGNDQGYEAADTARAGFARALRPQG